jgi:hydroxymethylglutaryl-CoA synthase
MVGIASYGAYIPWHRMERGLLAKAWGGFAIPGEKAVASYDEDSLTMAVEAARDCLSGLDSQGVGGLFFASTTSPYKEKQCSAIIAMPLDLRSDIRTADITTSLRSGTTAMALALDSIKAGTANSVLVTAADSRLGAPGGMIEQSLGDGAASVLLSNKDVIARVSASYSISDELAGTWRAYGDTFVRSWEDRMVLDESYSKVLPEAISGVMRKCGLKAKDFAKVVFDPPTDLRRHARVAAELGFETSQVQDPINLFMNVGITGSAMALMMLVSALEEAKPGDKIIFAGYGNGADAFVLEVTDEIERLGKRRGIKGSLDTKRMLDNYPTYLRWRDIVPMEEARRPEKRHLSLSAIWRERRVILGLWGIKCRRCGTPQYDYGAMNTTPIRVCAVCQAQDDFENYKFSGKKGTVFSYTQDNLAPSADPPATVVMIDFEGGGRSFFDLTDRDPAEVKVGMGVEMTFRKMQFDRGLSNYFWKTRPVR